MDRFSGEASGSISMLLMHQSISITSSKADYQNYNHKLLTNKDEISVKLRKYVVILHKFSNITSNNGAEC